MSIEGREGLGPQASCSGVLRSGYYTFSVLLFLLAKNAAALGYHGYHIIEDIMDIMVSASDIITLAKECWGERWGAISGCRREGMVWLLTVWWSGYPKAPA